MGLSSRSEAFPGSDAEVLVNVTKRTQIAVRSLKRQQNGRVPSDHFGALRNPKGIAHKLGFTGLVRPTDKSSARRIHLFG